jgi:hypothetical protein
MLNGVLTHSNKAAFLEALHIRRHGARGQKILEQCRPSGLPDQAENP